MQRGNAQFYRLAPFDGWIAVWSAVALLLAASVRPCDAEPFAYVTHTSPGRVDVIDTATNALVTTLSAAPHASGVAVTPDGKRAYYGVSLTTPPFDVVVAIDTTTNVGIASIEVSKFPTGLAVTPDGKRVYVTHPGLISVIDTASNTVLTTIPFTGSPFRVAITPNGKFAYITDESSHIVSVIDTATNSVAGTVQVGQAPQWLAFTPDGKHAYVVNNGSNNVSVIETASNTVVATVAVGNEPVGIAITPDGKFAYVTNPGASEVPGTVSVVDTATNKAVATIPVGFGPQGIAITPDGKHVYVADTGEFGMSIIDAATNTVEASAPSVGGFDVAISPPSACGSGDAVLAHVNCPAAGKLTYDVSSPTRTLHSISVIGASNIGSFTLPAVSADGRSATGGIFVKADPNESASFALNAAFTDPPFACAIDPTTITVQIASGHRDVQSLTMIPKAKHFIEINNGTPGLRWLRIEANGKYFRTLSLTSGRTLSLDASAAMTREENTLTLTGERKAGTFANVSVSDSAWTGKSRMFRF